MSSNERDMPLDASGFMGLEAPRYTSYPSAHHFSAQVDAATHHRWLADIADDTTISAYVHIPFCRELCWFCGCHTKMTKRYEPIAKYVRVLLKEIELLGKAADGKGRLVNIHFGGGSPSLLAPNDWLSILYALASAFQFSPPGALAIELDPRTTTQENIATYGKLGCNRASIGIQDFNSKVQQAIHRLQPYDMVRKVVNDLRQAGIRHINCDLIYGLPYQTSDYFAETLEKTLSLDPERISLFSYAHMPQLKKHQRLIEDSWLPSMQDKLGLYRQACRTLEDVGYVMIGIDHFAKPEDTLTFAMKNRTMRRNFQGYVVDDTDVLIGIGSSAISQFPQGYTQNHANTPEYSARINSGSLATVRGWVNRGDDRVRKRIVDALMCFMEVDLNSICAEYGLSPALFMREMESLKSYVAQGILAIEGWHIRISTPYRMAARVIAAEFDAYRGTQTASYSKVA